MHRNPTRATHLQGLLRLERLLLLHRQVEALALELELHDVGVVHHPVEHAMSANGGAVEEVSSKAENRIDPEECVPEARKQPWML